MNEMPRLELGVDSAWVTCEGEVLPLFGVEVDPDANKVTAWIPSEVDKCFEVHVATSETVGVLAARVQVDGALISGKLLGENMGEKNVVEGKRVGTTSKQKLRFAEMRMTEDDTQLLSNETLSKLGLISVSFYEAEVVAQRPFKGRSEATSLPSHSNPISVYEQQKKLGGHHATLDDPVPSKRSALWQSRLIHDMPRSTFEFRYRPLSVLQAQDIAPLSDPMSRSITPAAPPPPRKRRRPDPEPETRPTQQHARRNSGEGQTTLPVQRAMSPAKRTKREDPEYTKLLEERIRRLEAGLPASQKTILAPMAKVEPAEIHASKYFRPGEVIDLTDM